MRRLSVPSPSMGVALTALAVSLGGTSYAAMQIGSADVRNNSLTGQDIRNQSLTGTDVRNGSLRSADVRDGSLVAKDFRAGQLPAARWLLVNAAGDIEAQSGGFSIASAYGSNNAPAGAARNVYINAGEDLTDNGIVASIALQNQTEQGGDAALKNGLAMGPDRNPEFSGEISATRCGMAGIVACAPTGTDAPTHLVVSPRLSDGAPTDATNRKRFYVIVTG